MANKNKQLKRLHPKDTRLITVREQPDYDSHKPIFSFYCMQYGGKNCLSQCDQPSKASVVDTLLRLSQRTWAQIRSTHKGGLGFELIPRSEFKVALPPTLTEDVTKLKVFRYSEPGRIAGYRERDVYHILIIGSKLYTH